MRSFWKKRSSRTQPRSPPASGSWPHTDWAAPDRRRRSMAYTLKMPEVGETVTEGTIEKWLKQPGEKIEKYEPIVEINTDKVNVELPSPVTGTVLEIVAKEGETVLIGA